MKRVFNFTHDKFGIVMLAFFVVTLFACGGGGGGGAGGGGTASGGVGEASVTVTRIAGSSTVASNDATGTAASFNSIHGATVVGGNLYVADINNHNIRKIVIATGVVTTFAGKKGIAGATDATGTAATFISPAGITNDGTNLYVSEWGNNKIRKIVIATGEVTTLVGSGSAGAVDATGTAASFNYPSGIAIAGGNLYVADKSNHKIRKIVIASGEVTTVAGSGTAGSLDATGTVASFRNPYDIATDGSNLYVADTDNNKIRKIVIATGAVTTLAGSGAYSAIDDTGIAATFASPSGVVFDGGSLYVTQFNSPKVRKIVIATALVSTLAGSGTAGAVDATGVASSFFLPRGIASDGSNLYVADNGNHKVRKVVIASGVVTTLAGSEQGFSTDATGTAATFFYPAGIVSDGSNLYIADKYNHKIRRYEIANGAVSTLAGSGAYGYFNATGSAATFAYPEGIAINGGDLYVADASTHIIRKIVIATGVVTTLVGTANTAGAVDATGTAASFNYPRGLATDGTNLYVSDTSNNKIRKIVIATGVVTTLAGSGAAGATDAAGTAASFKYPEGLVIDGANLYVADASNHKIRKIVIATGEVSTFAGSGAAGSANGAGTAASFTGPEGITSDGTNLFVADQGNNKIRKIVIATGEVSTKAGTGNTGVVDGTGATASFFHPIGITAVGRSLYVIEYGGHTLRKIQ